MEELLLLLGRKPGFMGQTVHLSNGLPSCIRPGEILAGKYRLERELGRGAMGTVWSAMHLTLGQRFAIKLISAEHAQSPEARTRFSTEAKAAARLKSRHVVQVYDDGETSEGTPFIVMEYLEGESLESRLEREGSVPLIDAVRITGQVARALARAHAHGIVHRDLKPGNIFLARNDEDELGWLAKVLDFGIAKIEETRDQSTTKTGTVLGTPLFMSPEQVRGASAVDHRADLYSLGMCFFNMLTGRFGFEGESFGAILVSICTEPLPDLRTFTPWVSDEIALWFQRCCARDPASRYQSADELIDGLQSAVGTTVQIVNRRAAPDEQLGPSGTLKGHSPPVSPNTNLIGADDSGQFTVRYSGTPVSPPSLHTQPGVSSESTSVLTVPGVDEKKSNGTKAAVGVFVCLALAAGIGFFLRQKPAELEPAASLRLAATSQVPQAETKPAPAKPVPEARPSAELPPDAQANSAPAPSSASVASPTPTPANGTPAIAAARPPTFVAPRPPAAKPPVKSTKAPVSKPAIDVGF